jgi:hypothetical protein
MPLTQVSPGLLDSNAQYYGFKNRIINGAMVIDQRNNGAAVTTSSAFPVDRFTQAFGNASCSFQQVSDAPSGFINSLKLTVTTGSAPSAGTNNAILQKIEGLNTYDFGLGTASATTFTLSFWVKGSVAGTYAVAFTNSAFNRSYVATYTINAANTWEYKTVTVAGDTTGTWLTTNGAGLTVLWDFGSGTNLNTTAGAWQAGNFYRTSACTTIASTTNATLQVTGVQLEKGSTATSFDYRPYGTELALCQRYCYQVTSVGGTDGFVRYAVGECITTQVLDSVIPLPVQMRITPSLTTPAASQFAATGSPIAGTVISLLAGSGVNTAGVRLTVASGLTVGRAAQLMSNNNNTSYLLFSSEL